MTDLADFLTARIDEDQLVAEHATPGPWLDVRINDSTDGWDVQHVGSDGTQHDVAVDHAHPAEGACGGADARHVARYHPVRVLAECEAKRRIVEQERQRPEKDYRPLPPEVDTPTLRLLALPYADHPDYDQAWRP